MHITRAPQHGRGSGQTIIATYPHPRNVFVRNDNAVAMSDEKETDTQGIAAGNAVHKELANTRDARDRRESS